MAHLVAHEPQPGQRGLDSRRDKIAMICRKLKTMPGWRTLHRRRGLATVALDSRWRT
jgi:hypothetical protein